jgi:UDP-N-acetylglucosamine 1-carboxyvinyltransferase
MYDMKIVINGRRRLSGSVKISGAKNAALPELATAILSSDEFEFEGVPEVEDIKVMFEALKNIGAEGEFINNKIKIKIPSLKSGLVPKDIIETSRASILILGPLIARNGYAKVSLPGGCPIGDRKIDFHLEGLKKMGAKINIKDGYIIAESNKLNGIEYTFPNKSVTGTENLLMASTLAEGETFLGNCALEPEISDLINLLLSMGADIKREENDSLIIKGKTSLKGSIHKVIPDRIEMGTYIIAGCLLDNEIIVENAIPEYIKSLLNVLENMGIKIIVDKNKIKVNSTGNISPIDIETKPYPGFPTDLQAQLTTLLTQANGISRIKENIFNRRFRHVDELNKLGANIEVKGNTAIIKGKTELRGGIIKSTDLRASAALLLGGLIADGETVVENSYQLFRGYENMPEKLSQLGADIKLIGR